MGIVSVVLYIKRFWSALRVCTLKSYELKKGKHIGMV